MEDFINRIIEIDKKARAMTIDSDSMRESADKEIAEKTAVIGKDIDEKTDKAVEEYRVSTQKASDDKLASKKAYYEKLSSDFGEIYERDKEKWVDELVKRTLA